MNTGASLLTQNGRKRFEAPKPWTQGSESWNVPNRNGFTTQAPLGRPAVFIGSPRTNTTLWRYFGNWRPSAHCRFTSSSRSNTGDQGQTSLLTSERTQRAIQSVL